MKNRPFTDDIRLQNVNSIGVGGVLHSNIM